MMAAHKSRTVLALVLAFVLFFAFNVVVNRVVSGWRIDFTEDRLYTLSDGTIAALEALEEPITIRFYFSKEAATGYGSIVTYATRVEDLLREYAAIAGGKIALSIVNPEPFSDAEDDAVAAGLQGIPTTAGDTIFFGLAASDTTDREVVIPYFSAERENFLEYDLTKAVYSLSRDSLPKLAVLTALPMQFGDGGVMAFAQGRGAPWVVYDQLQEFFDVSMLGPQFDAIPDDTDVLLIAHPPALGHAELFLIDQFILGGGRAAIFVDPYAESVAQQQPDPMGAQLPTPPSSNLETLFAAWGIDVSPDQVVGDVQLAQRVNMGGSGINALKDYVVWLGVDEAHMSKDDIVTANLDRLNIAVAGAVRSLEEDTGVTLTPLVSSSEVSALVDTARVRGMPDPDALLRDLVPDAERYTLVGRLSGTARTAFPDGKPESEEETVESLKEGQINVIVGGDADLFADGFWVQLSSFAGQRIAVPFADNGPFLINAIDNLAGSAELISLRSRGVSQRPFTRVDDLRKAAEARFLAEEQALQDKLTATEARIASLEQGSGAGAEFFSPEQEAEIARFREELLATRKQLRDVQRNLRRDIERLGDRMTFLNVAAMPIVLALIALGLFAARRLRKTT